MQSFQKIEYICILIRNLMMKKILLIAYLYIAAYSVHAQTSPTPYNLSSGAYTFTAWDSLAPALSYPTNMMFHTLGNQNPDENTPANGDWACAYQSLNGCWIQGKDTTGVAFRNIGSSQLPTCMANGSGANIYVGDATVALNTTTCENITVSWIGRMISSFNYADSIPISRFYGIACQYRIGTTGAFTNVPGNYLFKCNSDSATYKPLGTADTLVSVLPDTCNNQPIVEVRWIYHQTAQNAGGPRPILGLDDINITRDIVTSAPKQSVINKPLFVYPNPVHQGKINLSKATNFMVVDLLGQTVNKTNYGKDFSIDNLPNGVYFIKTTEGEIIKFMKQ
jgi:hypothetical protein